MAQVPGDERVVHGVADKADAFGAPGCLATRLRDIGKSHADSQNFFALLRGRARPRHSPGGNAEQKGAQQRTARDRLASDRHLLYASRFALHSGTFRIQRRLVRWHDTLPTQKTGLRRRTLRKAWTAWPYSARGGSPGIRLTSGLRRSPARMPG